MRRKPHHARDNVEGEGKGRRGPSIMERPQGLAQFAQQCSTMDGMLYIVEDIAQVCMVWKLSGSRQHAHCKGQQR